MTPEEKAKEIVEKYRKITYIDEYGNENYERLSLGAAKSFAIEEVKAVLKICPAADGFNPFLREDDSISFVDYYMKILTEIENL